MGTCSQAAQTGAPQDVPNQNMLRRLAFRFFYLRNVDGFFASRDPPIDERLGFEVRARHVIREPAPLAVAVPDEILICALRGRLGITGWAFNAQAQMRPESAHVPEVLKVAV